MKLRTFTPALVLVLALACSLAQAQQSATKQLTITVVAPLAITTVTLPSGMVGQPYAGPIAVTGGLAPYVCSWQPATGSAIPAWASITATATGCLVGGTPTASAGFAVVVTVRDSSGAAARAGFGGFRSKSRSFGHRLLHIVTFGRK